MSATSKALSKKPFLQRAWVKVVGVFFALVIFFLVLAYANGSRIIVLVDEHFYEETLVVCVNVMSWIAPDRLKLELQTFCNVSMFTIAAEHQKAQQSQD